jgi:hypothetical protein
MGLQEIATRVILSPQRLPFRHPGTGTTNLTSRSSYCKTTPCIMRGRNTSASVVVSIEVSVGPTTPRLPTCDSERGESIAQSWR